MSLRTVVLLRHGQAEHHSPNGDDHGRPLTTRGRQQIAAISHYLHNLKIPVSQIYCSNSRRTTETLANLAPEISHGAEVSCDAALYHAPGKTLFDFLFQTADTIPAVLFVGHNPGLSEMATYLAQRHIHLGTGEAVVFQGDFPSWSDGGLPSNWNALKI
jgi:phosphohistidine phosphatase